MGDGGGDSSLRSVTYEHPERQMGWDCSVIDSAPRAKDGVCMSSVVQCAGIPRAVPTPDRSLRIATCSVRTFLRLPGDSRKMVSLVRTGI